MKFTLFATRKRRVGPRDSRHEQIKARGTVVYEDDRRLDFKADDGEVRVFMKDEWHTDYLPRHGGQA